MTDFFVLIGTKQEEALRSYTSDLEDTKSAYVQILAGIGNLDETFAALQALVKSMTDNVQVKFFRFSMLWICANIYLLEIIRCIRN